MAKAGGWGFAGPAERDGDGEWTAWRGWEDVTAVVRPDAHPARRDWPMGPLSGTAEGRDGAGEPRPLPDIYGNFSGRAFFGSYVFMRQGGRPA